MRDKASILEVLERYWYGLDDGDVEAAVSVFTEDAGYGTWKGLEEIRIAVGRVSELRAHHSARGNSRIDLDGDRAHAVSFVVTVNVEDHDGHELVLVRGLRYTDDLVRTAAGWRIATRRGESGGPHDDTWQFEAASVPPIVHVLELPP